MIICRPGPRTYIPVLCTSKNASESTYQENKIPEHDPHLGISMKTTLPKGHGANASPRQLPEKA